MIHLTSRINLSKPILWNYLLPMQLKSIKYKIGKIAILNTSLYNFEVFFLKLSKCTKKFFQIFVHKNIKETRRVSLMSNSNIYCEAQILSVKNGSQREVMTLFLYLMDIKILYVLEWICFRNYFIPYIFPWNKYL